MSRTTDYVLDMVDSGELVYVEGRGYIEPEEYQKLVDEFQYPTDKENKDESI